MSIAQQKPQPSRRKIVLMIFLDRVRHEGHPRPVLFAMPPRAIGPNALIESLIHFRIGE